MDKLTLDTEEACYFYEQEFYPLSNFSSFQVHMHGIDFYTAEVAYHWSRFTNASHKSALLACKSSHEAFIYAQQNKKFQIPTWDSIKVGVMFRIIEAKFEQHEYVRRKLWQTGQRRLVENSWRDGFWGWGENRDGMNKLGELWMELRRFNWSSLCRQYGDQ